MEVHGIHTGFLVLKINQHQSHQLVDSQLLWIEDNIVLYNYWMFIATTIHRRIKFLIWRYSQSEGLIFHKNFLDTSGFLAFEDMFKTWNFDTTFGLAYVSITVVILFISAAFVVFVREEHFWSFRSHILLSWILFKVTFYRSSSTQYPFNFITTWTWTKVECTKDLFDTFSIVIDQDSRKIFIWKVGDANGWDWLQKFGCPELGCQKRQVIVDEGTEKNSANEFDTLGHYSLHNQIKRSTAEWPRT